MVALLVHSPRAARRPYGHFPNVFPRGPAAVFLFAESREPGHVPCQPGARTADVSAGHAGHNRGPNAGGQMNRSTASLAALHLVGNALLLWLGYYWLGLGESDAAHLAWNAIVIVLFTLGALWLHGTALVLFNRETETRFAAAARIALRHLAPLFVIAAGAAVVYLLV